jgi:hypothetical protein
MDFGKALHELKSGHKIARLLWNGGASLHIRIPDPYSKLGHAYPHMQLPDGNLYPWTPNCIELMAEDWVLV